MARVICPNCSNAFTPPPGGLERCPRCGYSPSGAPVPARAAAPAWSSAGAPSFAPAVATPGVAMAPPGAQVLAAPSRETNGFAIASLILGIVGLPLVFFAWLVGTLAIIFGIVALTQIKKRGQGGRGLAIAGIILGSVWILLSIAFIGFITAFF